MTTVAPPNLRYLLVSLDIRKPHAYTNFIPRFGTGQAVKRTGFICLKYHGLRAVFSLIMRPPSMTESQRVTGQRTISGSSETSQNTFVLGWNPFCVSIPSSIYVVYSPRRC